MLFRSPEMPSVMPSCSGKTALAGRGAFGREAAWSSFQMRVLVLMQSYPQDAFWVQPPIPQKRTPLRTCPGETSPCLGAMEGSSGTREKNAHWFIHFSHRVPGIALSLFVSDYLSLSLSHTHTHAHTQNNLPPSAFPIWF